MSAHFTSVVVPINEERCFKPEVFPVFQTASSYFFTPCCCV